MSNAFDFLLIKDPHFMFGFRNNIRKYGWEKAIDSKINQIIEYAKDNEIQHIFFTGDVFEKSKKKDWSFNQMQQNKSRLMRFKDAGLTVYSNMGNHDYFDGHEDIHGTIFGEMVELGLIAYIGTRTHPINIKQGTLDIELNGIDHHQSIDVILDKLNKINAAPKPDFRMVLMHSNITDQQTRLTDFHYNQLADYNIDVFGCGHWHLEPASGAIQTLNKTTFLNPWNLTRVMRDYNVKLDEHKPSFIHGNIVKVGNDVIQNYKEIQLVVDPFSEAFNRDIINLLQELGKDGFDFFNEIDLSQDDDLNDDNVLIDVIAEQYNIREESKTIAKELLT